MSWRLLDRPKTQKVTKKLAREFAEMDPAPHDRPLSERRLQVYQRLLKDGLFRPVTWASALCVETGGVYRVNGKHTSIMLSGLEQMPEFYVTVEEYECDTLEDVARLYATFDSRLQSRSANDIYRSFAATVPELAHLPHRTINLAVAGIEMHESGCVLRSNLTAADRAERLLDHVDFVVWVNGVLSGGSSDRQEMNRRNSRHLTRVSCVAAMLGTWLKAKAQAEVFWSAVRDESGSSQNLPDRKLARYLLTTGILTGSGAKHIKTATPREVYVKCLHAWNAWRKNEATELKYYADKDVPSIK